MIRILAMTVAVCALFAAPAMASGAKGPDYEERVALAKKMHEISPARQQVEDAVNGVANRLPVDNQDGFKRQVMKSIDVAALETKSIETMADTFTKAELTRMLEYFSAPEAAQIKEKMKVYQSVMSPIIIQMLDKAAMEARTGGSAAPTPGAQPKKP